MKAICTCGTAAERTHEEQEQIKSGKLACPDCGQDLRIAASHAKREPRRRANARRDAMWAILLSFPAAAVVTALWRFPIPFAGRFGGVEAIGGAMFAVVFYGVFCFGFLVVGALGIVAGILARRIASHRKMPGELLTFGFCFLVDLALAIFLGSIRF